MINWIISWIKGKRHTASELVKDIVKRLEIELKDTSDFSSQMEKLELLFGKPYDKIKGLAEDETINASKTPEFNKYFGGISDILATILWLIKKIRKNNEAISLRLKELSRLDKGNIRVHNNHYQITSNFEEYLKKILVVMFSEMQKMAIEGNIAGESYKYGELVENLEKLHEDFNSLSDRIAYTKKMLQENKAVLEEIVNRYRVNLEAKGSDVSPSLARWILVTLFSIDALLGCGSVPSQKAAQYQQLPQQMVEEPKSLSDLSMEEMMNLAVQSMINRPKELRSYSKTVKVLEEFKISLQEIDALFENRNARCNEYYTSLLYVWPPTEKLEVSGGSYYKIKEKISYTPREKEYGWPIEIPIIGVKENSKERYLLRIILNVGKENIIPPTVDKEKLG